MKNIVTRLAFIVLTSLIIQGCKPCGNGKLQTKNAEQCDDGNNTDGDGCSAACLNEQIVPPNCGDGTLQAAEGEQCDDGNVVAGDGCDAACQIEISGLCGNGNVELGAGEECEPPNTATCDANCHLVVNALCGNGVIDAAAGEVCDDGNTTAGDGCRSDCFGLEVCGDNLVDTAKGEQCDPPGAACDLNCTIPAQCNGLGVEGSPCTQSSDCCQLAQLGCLDTNNDAVADTCLLLSTGGPCPTCGTGGSAHPCECCDGLDNDNDGFIDTTVGNNDPQCLGPTDDNELEFATGIPGDNNGANGATECPFDGNSGIGNDGDCHLFVPNGCDCSLCCGLDGNQNQTTENLFAGGGNCRDATPNNVAGTEGGPCTFTDANNDGVADNAGGCGTVSINNATVNLSCILDGNGSAAYCSTCVGCAQRTDCVNTCNCCENCVGGIQTAECDPTKAGQNVGVEGGDGDADTINNCPATGLGVCETNTTCTAGAVPTGCQDANGEVCQASSANAATDVCFQAACAVSSDCPSTATVCSLGCCVAIP